MESWRLRRWGKPLYWWTLRGQMICVVLVAVGCTALAVRKYADSGVCTTALTKIRAVLGRGSSSNAYNLDSLGVKLIHGSAAGDDRQEVSRRPLVYAAHDARLLGDLRAGHPKLNAKSENDDTLLARAANEGNPAYVRILLQAGANPNVVGPDRLTPLEEAVHLLDVATTKMLLQAGARVNPGVSGHPGTLALARSTSCNTAPERAAQSEIVKLLQKPWPSAH